VILSLLVLFSAYLILAAPRPSPGYLTGLQQDDIAGVTHVIAIATQNGRTRNLLNLPSSDVDGYRACTVDPSRKILFVHLRPSGKNVSQIFLINPAVPAIVKRIELAFDFINIAYDPSRGLFGQGYPINTPRRDTPSLYRIDVSSGNARRVGTWPQVSAPYSGLSAYDTKRGIFYGVTREEKLDETLAYPVNVTSGKVLATISPISQVSFDALHYDTPNDRLVALVHDMFADKFKYSLADVGPKGKIMPIANTTFDNSYSANPLGFSASNRHMFVQFSSETTSVLATINIDRGSAVHTFNWKSKNSIDTLCFTPSKASPF